MLRLRLAEELGSTRRSIGLSFRECARRIGVSHDRLARAERGDESALTIDLAARYAVALGLKLAVSVHPDGDAVRDQGQLALIERFRKRLPLNARLRTEVAIPITGDQRSADGVVHVAGTAMARGMAAIEILVEAETHLGDFQAAERRMGAKARDLGADRAVLLLADTRHNRAMVNTIPGIRERFRVDMRTWFRAIAQGQDPGGDALVIL
jgi:transcriptional regulator with XRE-family HTH domain